MAGTQIQRRRGTTAQHAAFTGAAGETTIDTDKNTVVVHNGIAAGGFPLAKESVLATKADLAGSTSQTFSVGPATATTNAPQLQQIGPFGQCECTVSAGSILMKPLFGNKLTINGLPQTIPAAGVTLAATSLTVGTLYYVYAYMNGATMTLEASTTGHSTDTTTGQEIKTGDATRTLVAMARPIAGPAFVDGGSQKFLANWFNPKPRSGVALLATNAATTSTAYAEITSAFRMEFVTFARRGVRANFNGTGSSNSAAGYFTVAIGVDGSTSSTSYGSLQNQNANSGTLPCLSLDIDTLAEGYHFLTLLGNNAGAGNAVQIIGNGVAGTSCALGATIMG